MEQLPTIKAVDKCGRITIPKGIRESFGIELGDKLAITADDECIQIRKISSSETECIFCGVETEFDFKGVSVCSDCIDEMYATV